MKEKTVKEDSAFIKAHIMCWEELLEEFLSVGLSESDIDFDMTENRQGQFIVHLRSRFFKCLKKYYMEKGCYLSKEASKNISFKENSIFIEKDHANCLAALQYVISCYHSKISEEFEEGIRSKKTEMKVKLKTVIEIAGLSSAITVEISSIYYKLKKDEYFANLKFRVGKRLLKKVIVSSKDTLDEIVKKLKN